MIVFVRVQVFRGRESERDGGECMRIFFKCEVNKRTKDENEL